MKRFVFIAALLALVGLTAFAQTTGTLTGNVTTEGQPLPGVTVTASSPNLQGTRTTYTDVNGNYTLGGLPPGRYTVSFELAGMQAVSRQVNVPVGSTARLGAELVVTAVAEAITVTADAPAVIETTEIQQTFQEEFVEELPVNRTILGAVNLAPGVNNEGPGGNMMISGAPSYDSVYFIDGAAVNENLRGQPQSLFIEDAIQETTVLTGGISAEYGRFTGGVVNTITKSGGNEFSGSLRDSFADDDWRETFPEEDEVPDTETTEVYEATLGGYVMRDRLWFFTAGRFFEDESIEFLARSQDLFLPNRTEETRLEGKLTGQITQNHSLVGTILDVDRPQLQSFGTPAEESVLDEREVPERYYSFNYNGIITNNFLIEAIYADKHQTFVSSGGDPIGAPMSRERFVTGTNLLLAQWGAWAGAPVFGTQLGDKVRASENATLKGTYYLSTANLGTHNLVVGLDDWVEETNEDNNQSASDFTVYSYATPSYDENGNLRIGMSGTGFGGLVIWWPVLFESDTSAFRTSSIYLNDKWDLNDRLSFNLGVRYDKNDGEDQFGQTVADDSKVAPRLGATWDIFGDGRVRANATYGEYVSKIAGGNVGDSTSPAGSPSLLYWLYRGPTIAPTSSQDLLGQVWDWFQSVGGIDNRTLLLGGGANGFGSQVKGTLISPSVNEFTVGVGGQIGRNGFIRVDYQNREWEDFYVAEQTLDSPIIEDPLVGSDIQVEFLTNSTGGDVVREYEAILLQAGYRLFNRLNLGANYTYSELTGNYTGETGGSGPVSEIGRSYQPELLNYARRDPIGTLGADRPHKLNAWASLDVPTPIGEFNFSVLHQFESGAPYDIAGTIDLACEQCREDPGYTFEATEGGYFFSDRGEFRLDETHSTDLAINYMLPLWQVDLFFQGEVFNVFDNDTVIAVDQTVFTALDDPCSGPEDTDCIQAFDPFTETPEEGVHYVLGPNFGEPVSNGSYQFPRSWRFSVGLRF